MNAIGIEKLAAKLDCSERTVERVIAEDPTFPVAFRLGAAGNRKWRDDEVDAWIAARAHAAAERRSLLKAG
jgi:predicted DNA-binding transcriptional regulator AlpA